VTAPLPDAASALAGNAVAADSHSLDSLRLLANRDPAKAVRQVATQFEALFMQMVLKSMREATPRSGMFNSSEEETYTGMLDQQLAQKIAAGGTGLGDVIARQLSRNLPSEAAPRAAKEGPSPATVAPPAPNPAAPTLSTGGTAATAAKAAAVSPPPVAAPAPLAAGGASAFLQSLRASRAMAVAPAQAPADPADKQLR
jgi:flagellar protein FlgJ